MIKKMLKSKRKKDEKLPSRITNDTVAQHRERVLAGGRKHKYPVQYTKHKLVWNTLIIGSASLILAALLIYLQLYVWKDTSDLAYRITRILPLPAASVDGEWVRYSDYLLYNRGNMAVLKSQGQDQASDKVNYQRQRAMGQAVQDAYVRKLAKEKGITVDEKQVDEAMDRQQKDAGLSAEAYRSAVQDMLGWSLEEAREGIRASLLRWRVSQMIDEDATKLAADVGSQVSAGKSLADISTAFGQKVQLTPELTVPHANKDGGLTEAALKVADGKTSGVIKPLGGDGYYFVHVISRTDTAITYTLLKVPLTELKEAFDKLSKDNKIHYFVALDKTKD